MSKEIRHLSIKKEDIPKKRDPYHEILSAKAGASGRLASENTHYQRQQIKNEAEQEINAQINERPDQERAVILKDILEQIEQWAGSDSFELGESIKCAIPKEKARCYLVALKDELSDKYYHSQDKITVQQKEMILNWIQQLRYFLSTKQKKNEKI